MSIFFANSSKRIYEDKELNKISSLLFDKGVFNTKKQNITDWREDGDFKVKAEDTPSLTVMANSGNAVVPIFINNEKQNIIISENTSLSATVNENTSASLRNDAVILRVNQEIIANDQLNEEGSNALSMVVIAGSRPDPLTDGEIAIAVGNDPFIRLANIEVKSGVNEITQNDIKDARHLAGLTKKAKLETELLRIWGVDKDPEMISLGDIWYNQSEGILKLFDGKNTVAIQSQSFDWGYYGDVDNLDKFEAIDENISIKGLSSLSVWNWFETSQPLNYVKMIYQIFEMTELDNPFIRIKMGNPSIQGDVEIRTYTLEENGDLKNMVEKLEDIKSYNVPKNDYIGINLNAPLYSIGEKYGLVISTPPHAFSGSLSLGKIVSIQASKDEESKNLKGIRSGTLQSYTTNPKELSWGTIDQEKSFVMSFYEKDEIKIGRQDISGGNNQIIQPFTARSNDITSFNIIKGEDIGSPAGNINLRLYKSDINGKPIGSVLAQSEIDKDSWDEFGSGEYVKLPLVHDKLITGSRYAVVIDCDIQSDTDNYTIYFGKVENGTALRYNTADGYVKLNGELYYGYSVSSVNKIVTTGNDGLIPKELLKRRVQDLEYKASPEYDISVESLVMVSKATGAINLTENAKGQPYDGQEIEFRITASGGARTVTYGDLFENRWDTMVTSIPDNNTLRSVFQFDAIRGKFGCISSDTVSNS